MDQEVEEYYSDDEESGHRHFDHYVENDAIYAYDKKGKAYYLIRWIQVVTVMLDILRGHVSLYMQYLLNGNVMDFEMDRAKLTKAGVLSELPARGIDITDSNALEVLNLLLYQEERSDHVNIHKEVGWHWINEKLVFLHHKAIGGAIESEYRGMHNIEPKGDGEVYKDGIRRLVLGRIPLELAFALGMAAPIASRLRLLLGMEVIFVHIFGFSTTGKSTALMLALSTFGYPGKNNNGLQKSWLATYNALIGYLAGVHGIPVGMDEASVKANADFSNLIYTIAEGKDKGRQTQEGVNKDTAEWSGIVLSTGEQSLLGTSNANEGIRVRLLELGDVVFTDSADHAEDIKKLVSENYGHVGIEFVEKFQQVSDEDLMDAFSKSKSHVLKKITVKDQFTERIANKLAVIYMAAKLTQKFVDIELNAEAILEMLIKADIKQHDDRNLPLKAYEFIKEEINRNLHKYCHKDNLATFAPNKGNSVEQFSPRTEIFGKLEGGKTQHTEFTGAAIIRDRFDKILRDGGFTNPELILRKWRDMGILKADEGKLTMKRTVVPRSKSVRCVVITFENEIEKAEKKRLKDLEAQDKRAKQSRKKKTKRSKIMHDATTDVGNLNGDMILEANDKQFNEDVLREDDENGNQEKNTGKEHRESRDQAN